MKNKYFYPIFKLKAKSWIRYWLLKKTEFKGKLSEILEGSSFTLNNTLSMKFNLFEIYGNSIQDGEPSPQNEVPILSSGDNGSINEKINNKNWNTSPLQDGSLTNGLPDTNYETCRTTNFIDIKPSTNYAFSINGILNRVVISMYDKDKNFISTDGAGGYVSSNGLFTTYANAYYIKYRAYNADKQLFLNGKIQIELGSTATSYVPHEEQTYTIPVQRPMLSLGDVRDKFVKVNGNWYERHYITRYICKGNEALLNQTELETVSRWIIRMIGAKSGSALSNYYTYYANYTASTEHFYVANNQILTFHNKTITSSSQYLQYFAEKYASGNPVYFDYQLAEPLDLPCTEEQIEILENLPKTYAGQTNIYSPDEVKPFLKIQYWESDTNG